MNLKENQLLTVLFLNPYFVTSLFNVAQLLLKESTNLLNCKIQEKKPKPKQTLVCTVDARPQWTCGSWFAAVYWLRKIATSSGEMI